MNSSMFYVPQCPVLSSFYCSAHLGIRFVSAHTEPPHSFQRLHHSILYSRTACRFDQCPIWGFAINLLPLTDSAILPCEEVAPGSSHQRGESGFPPPHRAISNVLIVANLIGKKMVPGASFGLR